MAIYVGEKNALLLKNDRSVVEFYKGNTKIFGYNNSKQGRVITADDVHPIEHKLKINLSSDTIIDFSSVSVTRYGKNLWKNTRRLSAQHLSFQTIDENNIIFSLTKSNAGAVYYNWDIDLVRQADSFTISFDYKITNTPSEITENSNNFNQFCLRGKQNGASKFIKRFSLGGDTQDKQHFSKTFNKDLWNEYDSIWISLYVSIANGYSFKNYTAELSNIQLEVSSNESDFEPYNQQIVIANADGTVEGLTSLSPNMTVMSDNKDTILSVSHC